MTLDEKALEAAVDAHFACRPEDRIVMQDFGMQQRDIVKQQTEAAITAYLSTAPSGQAPLEGVWPDFKAPQQYENPAEGWTDPGLPDFRAIWAAAYSVGYSVGLHGSMKRDCDLIAAPWTDEAVSPEELVDAICKAINAKPLNAFQEKPLGRVALTLNVADRWSKPIDLSIMPRLLPASTEPVAYALRSELGWLDDIDNLGEPRLRKKPFENLNGEKSVPLYASPPASGAVEAGWQQKCATEGCGNVAGVYFERSGVGSHYCAECYLKIQALPAAPIPEG